MKQCTKCKEYKDKTKFNIQKITKDGLSYWCKDCFKAHQQSDKGRESCKRSYQKFKNSDKYKQYYTSENYKHTQNKYRQSESYKESRRRYLASPAGKAKLARKYARRRNRNKEIINDLSKDDIEFIKAFQDNRCIYCGEKFNTNLPYELDHIIPVSQGFGLTINNTQLLCRACNRKKSNQAIDILGLYIITGEYYKPLQV